MGSLLLIPFKFKEFESLPFIYCDMFWKSQFERLSWKIDLYKNKSMNCRADTLDIPWNSWIHESLFPINDHLYPSVDFPSSNKKKKSSKVVHRVCSRDLFACAKFFHLSQKIWNLNAGWSLYSVIMIVLLHITLS